MRRKYLDNLRTLATALVIIYHVFFMFSSLSEVGVGSFAPMQKQDAFLYFVYPWFMVLFFVISGMCARYALNSKTHSRFIRERTAKLLVPSTLGLFVFHWIVGYYNIKIGGGLEYIPTFIRYPVMALSGIGPLWFIQMLWLFSLLLVVLRKLDRNDVLWSVCKRTSTITLLLLFVLLWGAAQVLNAPILTVYRFGIYFAAFLIGYLVLSHDEITDRIQRIRIPLAIFAIFMGLFCTDKFFMYTGFSEDAYLKHILTAIYLWSATLAILGCGKAYLNKSTTISEYFARASFGIYIVHYAITLVICYYLRTYAPFHPFFHYLIAIIATFALSPALYELLRRIPIIRYLVLGIITKENQ